MITRILQSAVEKTYLLIFRQRPGDISKLFVDNLFYSYTGTLGSSVITFAFSIWAVRALGPTEYGKVNLVVSISQFLMTLLLFGLPNSATRYLAREVGARKEITSAIMANFALLTAVFVPIFWIVRNTIIAFGRLEQSIFDWALIYALIIGFSYIVQACLRGLGEFKKYALFQIVSGVIFAFSITYVFTFRRDLSYVGFIASSIFRWLVPTIIAAFILWPLLRRPNIHWMKETIRFGAYHIGTYLSSLFFIGMIDTVMLNYYRDAASVGLYSAYFFVFAVFSGKILNPLIEVFYPTVSSLEDAKSLLHKTLSGAKLLLPTIFAGGYVVIAVLFRIYGSTYQFSWWLAALTSLNMTIYTLIGLFMAIIGSRGIEGARINMYAMFAAALVNVLLNSILIPRWNLYGVMIATAVASTILLGTYWWILAKRNLRLV